MKRTILLLATIAATFFSSCSADKQENTEQQKEERIATNNSPQASVETNNNVTDDEEDIYIDSTMAAVDSFSIITTAQLKGKIELPPVYQHEIFEANNEATDKFSKLSKACHGKMKILVNSGEVVKEMKETIKAVSTRESDLLILMDRSGSMYDDIKNVKEGIHQIIDTIKKYKGTRLAIAIYGDKNWDWPGTWFALRNFETNYDAAARYVDSIQVISNNDWPESVYDAIVNVMENSFWQSTKKRNIILVGDAPPLEKPLSDYTLNDVINKAKQMKVVMNFYPILIMPEIHQVQLSQEDKDKYKQIKNNTKLYPNPSAGIVNLSMENTATYYLELYDVNGGIILNEEFYGITWAKDLSYLANGVYIMRVINADHSYEVIRFVIQH